MKIYAVSDPEFKAYGQIMAGYDTKALLAAMEAIPLPQQGVAYQPSLPALEACPIFAQLRQNAYGGMPVELGMCWGRNTKLNCLEYHRDSEINLGTEDFVLLLARREELVNNTLDTARVKAFRVPAGVMVEVYATALHYAPCHVDEVKGFRTAVVLPKGTNTAKPEAAPLNNEDRLLWACNKWLLAHPEADEAKRGAFVGLLGENLDIRKLR